MRTCASLWSSVVFVVLVLSWAPDSVENSESGETRDFNQTFFISEIFDKYGNSNMMTYEGFEHLLENLGLGRLKFETKHDVSIHKINGTFREVHDELLLHKHDHTSRNDSSRRKRNLKTEDGAIENLRRKCLTAQDILATYGLKPYHEVVISPNKYLQICPAIVYELDYKLCQVKEPEVRRPQQEDRRLVWTYATLSVLTMGLSGMACVAVVPWLRKERSSWVVQFLVALGAGTLCGDALIHLLPQVFCTTGKQDHETTGVTKGAAALLAIYFFFIVECVLKGAKEKKETNEEKSKESGEMMPFQGHGQGHGHGHSHGHRKAEMKTVASMAIMGDVLHNVTDGLSIGAAFNSSLSSGFASSIAIFCHELPHELGDYAILLSSGMSAKRALFYNAVSSVSSLLGMVAGVLLGELEDAALWINALTAGSFLYVALSDLVPEMKAMQPNPGCSNFFLQATGLAFGGILMLTIALCENQIESLLC